MINYNGSIQENNARIFSLNNRGLHYGDAVFETIKVVNGQILFAESHYFRLMSAMRIMRMVIPMTFTPELVYDQILRLTQASGPAPAYRIKFLVWRSWGGTYDPTQEGVDYMIQCTALAEAHYNPNHSGDYTVELFKDHYVPSGLLSTIKTNNRAINVLGSIYARENGFANCLLLNEQTQVIEALNGNLFLVKGYTIKTPPLADGCIKGIIRGELIALLAKHPDFILEQASISPFELQKADELFVTNTIIGVQSISQFRKKQYAHTVGQALLSLLEEQIS